MWMRCGLIAGLIALTAGAATASTFAVDTSAFINGGTMPAMDAASADGCGGRNISPPLRLSGAPEGVQSFAIVTFDIDAGAGRGFVHWVAYGIAPATRTLAPGFGSQPSPAFTGGRNDAGTLLYFGPCPPPGPPHHYVFTVYALDLAPARLPPGLTRAAFLHAIAKHRLAQAQISAGFGR
jgi:Raf kinase inhibitor-like YbhB/YbcL family protein